MPTTFADKIEMQHRLFAELSRMFGNEVPLYDKSLLVNRLCNRTVCDLLGRLHVGFAISDEDLDRTSGERHGAIRIGRPDEYRWISRFFAAFAMEPHNYYDMSDVGAKSQPITATAFRSVRNPDHRVFTSLLQTDYFDPKTRARIESVLSRRQVFSDAAKALIEKGERQGGLDWTDASALIREGTDRIFKWTGKARDHALYKDLCESGFKIAADIACFESHHLNHLTPNTFCIDLYTTAMKFCMGEISGDVFSARASKALARLASGSDLHMMRLQFKHLGSAVMSSWKPGRVGASEIASLTDGLKTTLQRSETQLSLLKHSGFKDTTEGPCDGVPVLLRQDSYKALTERVVFTNDDGSTVDTVHTARFGEIEQRYFATTRAGRALYDACLAEAEAMKEREPTLAARDFERYETQYAQAFSRFATSLPALLAAGHVYARYAATPQGLAAKGSIATTDPLELVSLGFASVEGLRYEDFLPVSAAGIFASNLSQYGTKSTAAAKPTYTKSMLEAVMGRPIIEADATYAAMRARSLLDTYDALGLTGRLAPEARAALQAAASTMPN